MVITMALRFRYHKRAFLARKSSRSTAFVMAEVESSEGGVYQLGTYMLVLADCHRRIELDFSVSTAYTRKESLAKADQLFEVIKAFHEGLHAEATLIEMEKQQGRQK
jgi:hypothetical protein